MKFGVITRVPDPMETGGNLMATVSVYVDSQAFGEPPGGIPRPFTDLGVDPAAILYLRVPVFALGELLILDDDGREITGMERKPSKWDVDVRMFDDLVVAIDFSVQVKDED